MEGANCLAFAGADLNELSIFVENLRMDIIEDDKKLREIFSKIVSEYEIKYCA